MASIDLAHLLKVQTVYKYEADLFDGISTVETVTGTSNPIAYGRDMDNDPDGTYMVIANVGEAHTGASQDHEGWEIIGIRFWQAKAVVQE